MKNIIKILIIATLILNVSCGKERANKTDNSVAIAVKVSTPTAESSTFITASGKIEAVQNANISTRMMGFVNNIYVKVGDKVNKDQLLISISNADISAQKAQVNASITEAMAAFKNAEKDYNRYKNLYSKNSVSRKEMDDMTAHYEMAKARLEAATQMRNQVDAQLSYANITAPFSGIITGKFINNGDMANPGMPLLSMENTSAFQVVAMVPESDVLQIKTGSNVNVLVKSTNEVLKGTVTEISTSTKNTGGQYLTKVILDKNHSNILSGMFVNVQFPSTKPETETVTANPILVPQSALIKKGQLTGIYSIGANDTAILRWIRTGKNYGDKVEVLSGLSAEETFIMSSEGKLYNGAKVLIN